MPKIITQIEIKRKHDEDSKTRRPYDLAPLPGRIGRRRITLKKKYLRVFDLARDANGADLNFFASSSALLGDPQYTPYASNFWTPSTGWVAFVHAPIDFMSEWNSYLTAVDPDEWPEQRYEFTEEMGDYGITVGPLNDYVPDKGFGIPSDITKLKGTPSSTNALQWDLLEALGQPFFPAWLDKDIPSVFAPFKLTKELDYAATGVSLEIDKSIDLFLAPAAFTSYAESRDYPIVDTSFPYIPQTWYNTGLGQRTVPRGWTSDPLWEDVLAGRGSNFFTASQDVREWMLDKFINNGTVPMFTMVADEFIYADGGDIIDDYTLGTAGIKVESEGAQNRIVVEDAFYLPGSLMGAVRKHLSTDEFEWYYIWANAFWSSLSPSFIGFPGGRV